MSEGRKNFSRLPACITPLNYDLWLKPCLTTFTFAGVVAIKACVNEPTCEVIMNCAEIKVLSAEYIRDDSIVTAYAISHSEAQEKLLLQFGNEICKGLITIRIRFEGILNNKMRGFYRNQYKIGDDVKFGAVTQFEATDARRCFPCWDEPALKATFNVTLVVPKTLCSLSNMNIESENEFEEDYDFKVTKYATTPKMSTYLLAIVIGEFDFIEQMTEKGQPIRVYTPKGKSFQGQFALSIAVKCLDYYEKYFRIDYPLPKLDLVAISDFCAGAMENWGLITYRETALLIDSDNSSAHARQWVSLVVCHELAHQWFGNLVTMEWWTHLWLNEGFATFMEYLATDHCLPEYNIWSQFVSHDYKRALDLDALDNSHPIEVTVGHPDEVDEIFDVISYSKGAAIIRMLYCWIGDDCFREGMYDYLIKHSYGNATTTDLWDALGNTSDKPVGNVMTTWTEQMGFPIIKASCCRVAGNEVALKLGQQRFTARHNILESGKLWSVPVTFKFLKSAERVSLLTSPTDEVVFTDIPEGHSWIKLNSNCCGFYRVQYDAGMLEALLHAVRANYITDLDKLNLLNDLFALSSSGISSTYDFLQSLDFFKNETSYVFWRDLDCNIEELSILLWDNRDMYHNFKSYILELFENIANKVGWDSRLGEGHLNAMLRSLIIRRMGIFGDAATIAEAKKRFQDHVSGSRIIPADLRSSVYQIVLTYAEENDLENLLKLHDSAELHEEKERIERSLGVVKSPEKLLKVLNFAMSDSVRCNDKVFVIGSVAASSSVGRNMAWDFVTSNWNKLHDMYKGTFLISKLVKMTTENFTTEEAAQEVENFFSEHPPSAAERTVHQSLDKIKKYAEWWSRDCDNISRWLSKYKTG